MNLWRVWQHWEDVLRFKPGQISRWGEGEWTRSSTLNLFAIATCWKRQSQLSPMECLRAYQPHSRTGPRSRWPTQNKTPYSVIYVLFIGGIKRLPVEICSNFGFCFIACLLLVLVFRKRKKKETWISGWGGGKIWEELEKIKTWSKYVIWEKF